MNKKNEMQKKNKLWNHALGEHLGVYLMWTVDLIKVYIKEYKPNYLSMIPETLGISVHNSLSLAHTLSLCKIAFWMLDSSSNSIMRQ